MLKQSCRVVLASSVCVELAILELADSGNSIIDHCSFARVSLNAYKKMQYTVANARHCMNLMDYVQTMVLHTCGVGILKDSYQLALAV